MNPTRLVGFEAAAVRAADARDTDELTEQLAFCIARLAGAEEPRPQDLRELAAAALVLGRRLDGRPRT